MRRETFLHYFAPVSIIILFISFLSFLASSLAFSVSRKNDFFFSGFYRLRKMFANLRKWIEMYHLNELVKLYM